MPELPEVETVVRDLRNAGLAGRRIRAVHVTWPKTIAAPSLHAFRHQLAGRTVTGVRRRAKYIIIELDDGRVVLVHLRMTGQFRFAATPLGKLKHDHVVLDLDDGRQLRYRDTRKFGRWWLLDSTKAILGKLGPEPLEPAFRARVLRERLAGRSAMLKPLLLNQQVVAGLGNIYVDEALFAAGLHPTRKADTLSEADVRRLHRAIRAVLRQGVDAMGTTLGTGSANFYSVAGRRGRNQDGLRVFRRTGRPCPRCHRPIERIVVGQRSTHICSHCQPPGDPG